MTTKLGKRFALVLTGALVAGSLALAAPVGAHTSIRESDPAEGAELEKAPATVSVTFGSPVEDAEIVVLDPCGTQVDAKDSAVETVPPRVGEPEGPGSKVTASMSGAMAGRYELQWFAQPLDGDVQSGVISFFVTEGPACKTVSRVDAKGDVEGSSLDITGVKSWIAKGKVRVAVATADVAPCSALGAELNEDTKNSVLDVIFETEQDGEDDLRGRFVCGAGTVKLRLTSMDRKTSYGAFKVTRKGSVLNAALPLRLPLRPEVGKHLDITVQSESLEEQCGDGCFDRGPDLGRITLL